MSITKANIVTALNNRLKRAETEASIAGEIKSGLSYLSHEGNWPCLHTSADVNLVAGNNSIDFPANFKKEDEIILNDGTSDSEPLEEISWENILVIRSGNPGRSEPNAYAKRGVKFELDSACEKAYTATVYYWQNHPEQATILFGDEFEEALYNAVLYKYLEGKKQHQEAIYHKTICDSELAKQTQDRKPLQVKYRDM